MISPSQSSIRKTKIEKIQRFQYRTSIIFKKASRWNRYNIGRECFAKQTMHLEWCFRLTRKWTFNKFIAAYLFLSRCKWKQKISPTLDVRKLKGRNLLDAYILSVFVRGSKISYSHIFINYLEMLKGKFDWRRIETILEIPFALSRVCFPRYFEIYFYFERK